jgi:mannose-6-phosphate isomerase-like protein (cupin superfamily)
MREGDCTSKRRYQVVDLASLPGVPCPCGTARRAFGNVPEFPGTIHLTEIKADAALHYHRLLTETYYILECEPDAKMQLDDEFISLQPGRCILIPPGVRHRAIGQMKVLIFVIPKFDPEDEFLADHWASSDPATAPG